MKRTTGQDRTQDPQLAPRHPRDARRNLAFGNGRDQRGAVPHLGLFAMTMPPPSPRASPARQEGMTYSRLQNPTVQMLEERIALLEGAEACRTQASGMAAMTAALLCQLSAGDHMVAARAAFGSCRWLGDQPAAALRHRGDRGRCDAIMLPGRRRSGPTPRSFSSRPRPIRPWTWSIWPVSSADWRRRTGSPRVVDNAFCSPALQRPMEFGADVVAYSATKLMDGQGRVLAGAVCG